MEECLRNQKQQKHTGKRCKMKSIMIAKSNQSLGCSEDIAGAIAPN
ncbi:11221_t:CDS:2, partial [Gigaspora rosea]